MLTGLQSEKSKIIQEIHATSVAKLHHSLDEGALLKELVAQFLVHDGYVETAKAFISEAEAEVGALGKSSAGMFGKSVMEDDLDALNRQRISGSPSNLLTADLSQRYVQRSSMETSTKL